jgi:ABC-2 type transport system ATP-binding protein
VSTNGGGGEPLVEIDGVTKRYGAIVALDDISASLTERAVGLLGANGAGKSTLMRAMLGLVKADSGRIRVLGIDASKPTWEIRRLLGYMPEHNCLPLGMTARDLVVHMGELRGLPRRVAVLRASEVLFQVGLEEERSRLIRTFSVGMKQRTNLAQAIVHSPGLVILDEPTNGLDPPGVRWLRGYLRRLADEGRTVLLSSHALSEVELTADHVLVLAHGRLLRSSTLAALRAEAGVGSRVRTPDPDRLGAALDAAGHRYRPTDEGLAVDATPEQVGELAAQHGVVLHGLEGTADLEQAFFRLIEQSGPAKRLASAEGALS